MRQIEEDLPVNADRKLHIKSLFKEAWQAIHGVKSIFFLSFIIYLVFYIIANVILYFTNDNSILSLIFSILLNLVMAGLAYMGLRRAYDKSIDVKMIFHGFKFKLAFKLIVAQILLIILFALPIVVLAFLFGVFGSGETGKVVYAIGAFIGFLIGFYFIIKAVFTNLLILAQEIGPIKAIDYSFKITRGNFWRVLGLILLSLLISVGSILTLGVAFIWTLPLLLILWGLAYKKLVNGKMLSEDFTNSSK